MDSMLRFASETLLQVADAIEKEAAEKSMFACDSCDNTISLAGINSAIRTASDLSGVEASDILVDDRVACNSCESGVMSYKASEESEKYYEPEETESSEEGTKEDTEKSAKEEAPEEGESSEDPIAKLASENGIDISKLSRYL